MIVHKSNDSILKPIGIRRSSTSVESRANFDDFGNGFDHLVAHALSCTIEDDVVCAKEYRSICFGSLMGCLVHGFWLSFLVVFWLLAFGLLVGQTAKQSVW